MLTFLADNFDKCLAYKGLCESEVYNVSVSNCARVSVRCFIQGIGIFSGLSYLLQREFV